MQADRLAVYNDAHPRKPFYGQGMIEERDLPSPNVKLEIVSPKN
jgi:hypothetical protein